MDKELVRSRVLAALEQIRPYLVSDGGDVELVQITDDMEVWVRLQGACNSCPFSAQTLQNGIVDTIMRNVPEVRAVKTLPEGKQ